MDKPVLLETCRLCVCSWAGLALPFQGGRVSNPSALARWSANTSQRHESPGSARPTAAWDCSRLALWGPAGHKHSPVSTHSGGPPADFWGFFSTQTPSRWNQLPREPVVNASPALACPLGDLRHRRPHLTGAPSSTGWPCLFLAGATIPTQGVCTDVRKPGYLFPGAAVRDDRRLGS